MFRKNTPWKATAAAAVSFALLFGFGAPSRAVETPGSALFTAASQQYLDAGASSDWSVGTGDFTVEWFQKQITNPGPTRIFSIGSYAGSTVKIGISIEGGTAYVWFNGGYAMSAPMSCALGAWTHVAITRSAGNLSLYFNGVHQQTVTRTDDIQTGTLPLLIGREENPGFANTYFDGYLNGFHFVNGTALYSGTSSFTPPSATITPVPNTKLLLNFNAGGLLTDSSASPKTVVGYSGTSAGGPTASTSVPFGEPRSTCGGTGGGGSGDGGTGTFPGQGNGTKKGIGSGPGQGLINGGKK